MAKQSLKVEINNFVGGLNTEASPLNFPPNATIDEENFELKKNGVRERRFGLDFEVGHSLIDTGLTLAQYREVSTNTFKWINAGGVAFNEFFVVQIGNLLKIFDSQVNSVSAQGFLTDIVVSNFPSNVKYSFTSVDGILTVVSGSEEVFIVEYDEDTGTFSSRYGRINVRDLWGVEVQSSGYEDSVLFRAATAPEEHIYNLRNQSWAAPRRPIQSNLNTQVDPIDNYRQNLGVFPSNSEVVWAGMVFRADTGPPSEQFQWNIMRDTFGADTLAAKGSFIIDLLRRGTSRLQKYQENQSSHPSLVYNVTSLPADITVGGPKAVTEFAGRVWFAGFGGQVVDGDQRSPSLSSSVFFSQLVQSPKDIFKCYQEGDPSSRDSSDILDTDGGFIRISGASNITAMVAMGRSLVVLAENGVWEISGTANNGFTATSYESSKLSSYGCISPYSVIVDGEALYYWSEDGVYIATRDQYGDLKVESISQDTIQTLYEEIPAVQKRNVVGVLDRFDKKIRWLYNTDSDLELENYSAEIVLDTNIGAFYKNRIFNLPQNSPEVIGVLEGSEYFKGTVFTQVLADLDPVVVEGDPVLYETSTTRSGVRSVRYLTAFNISGTVHITFSQYRNLEFRDWFTANGVGVDAKAYMLTGAITAEDTTIHKQVPYLIMHMYRTEIGVENEEPSQQSSCLVRSQWDWANSPASRKWSPFFQAYRYRRPLFVEGPLDLYDSGFETVVTKNKIRGRGRAFSFYMETEPYRDCRIIGWALDVNGNSKT